MLVCIESSPTKWEFRYTCILMVGVAENLFAVIHVESILCSPGILPFTCCAGPWQHGRTEQGRSTQGMSAIEQRMNGRTTLAATGRAGDGTAEQENVQVGDQGIYTELGYIHQNYIEQRAERCTQGARFGFLRANFSDTALRGQCTRYPTPLNGHEPPRLNHPHGVCSSPAAVLLS